MCQHTTSNGSLYWILVYDGYDVIYGICIIGIAIHIVHCKTVE